MCLLVILVLWALTSKTYQLVNSQLSLRLLSKNKIENKITVLTFGSYEHAHTCSCPCSVYVNMYMDINHTHIHTQYTMQMFCT